MRCGPKRGRTTTSRAKQSRSDVDPTKFLMPRVPEKCDKCGASIQYEKVNWTGPTSIECPYCGQTLTVHFEQVA